jgi:hypothetical protein
MTRQAFMLFEVNEKGAFFVRGKLEDIIANRM